MDFIDEDLAYLLGAIVARGEILRDKWVTTVVISYPFRNLEVEGLTRSYVAPDQLSLGLDKIVNRVMSLGFNVRKEKLEKECQLIIEVKTGSLQMRVLESHLGNAASYREFHVPKTIFESSESIQREFMRGYTDVAGHVRKSNYYIDGRHRVYIDVLNENWHLPVELCRLLQDYLKVPVQTIDWGHPNIRDPDLREYSSGRKRAWAREHQIKVFADAFIKIGFYVQYKDEMLNELAEYNRRNFPSRRLDFCVPKPTFEPKPHHPSEDDPILPPQIRGRHFDSYWQICEAMDCLRCKQQRRLNQYDIQA
ncbi:MAG: hypothetical protein QXR84_07125 [Candidatus Bathyarchaeia archaeon]